MSGPLLMAGLGEERVSADRNEAKRLASLVRHELHDRDTASTGKIVVDTVG
jgi:hypothetical protein